MFKKILIANRGEIACRIIRSCRRLGIRTVAVYSAADEQGLHRSMADEAIAIGPAESGSSYLDQARVLAAVRESGCDGVHPGYGFLSENPAFARALSDLGVTLIGPSADVIALMGDKLAAKDLAGRAAVPLVPGLTLSAAGADDPDNIGALRTFAGTHGYPILVKAASGGGGRGMRRVRSETELVESLRSAAREALAFFADARVFVEKLVESARHIEVQILGDRHGHVFVLGDRDCTLQRHHQKVIEEAPAPDLAPALRQQIHEAARRLGELARYENAGTVEFLLDRSGAFYFLEVNSRLQVEHPVTEAVMGIDLVELQLRSAAGEDLAPLLTGVGSSAGSAIELRLCAEVPEEGFAAATGGLECFEAPPASLPHRLDTGFRQGDQVTHYYDSLLAKLIVHRPTRSEAIAGALAALRALNIAGVRTNISFLVALLEAPEFVSATHHTHSAERYIPDSGTRVEIARRLGMEILLARVCAAAGGGGPWQQTVGFRIAGRSRIRGSFRWAGTEVDVALTVQAGRIAILEGGGERIEQLRPIAGGAGFVLGGVSDTVLVDERHSGVWVRDRFGIFRVEEFSRPLRAAHAGAAVEHREIRSPLPGKVLSVSCTSGEAVEAGQGLVIIESMKMEHVLKASAPAAVRVVRVKPGDVIEAGAVIVELMPAP